MFTHIHIYVHTCTYFTLYLFLREKNINRLGVLVIFSLSLHHLFNTLVGQIQVSNSLANSAQPEEAGLMRTSHLHLPIWELQYLPAWRLLASLRMENWVKENLRNGDCYCCNNYNKRIDIVFIKLVIELEVMCYCIRFPCIFHVV